MDSPASTCIAVVGSQEHRLFGEVRDIATETTSERYVTLDFEKEPDLDEPLLRKFFCATAWQRALFRRHHRQITCRMAPSLHSCNALRCVASSL